MKEVFSRFVFINALVSVAAAMQTLETYYLTNAQPDSVYLFFVFFSTLALYNFQRLQKNNIAFGSMQSERFEWQEKNRGLLFSALLISGLISTVLIFFLDVKSLILIFVSAILSIGYSAGIPFLMKKNIREIPFLKIFVLTSVWTIVTQIIPLIQSDLNLSEHIARIAARFLFIFSICIPFDIRDMDFDPKKMKTIPQLTGRKGSILLAVLLLVFTAILYWFFLEINQAIAMSVSAFIAIIIVAGNFKKRSELYYTGLTDGMMIIQFLIVMVSFLF